MRAEFVGDGFGFGFGFGLRLPGPLSLNAAARGASGQDVLVVNALTRPGGADMEQGGGPRPRLIKTAPPAPRAGGDALARVASEAGAQQARWIRVREDRGRAACRAGLSEFEVRRSDLIISVEGPTT